jgi:hypothetical protein
MDVEETENNGRSLHKIRRKWKIRTKSVRGGYRTE